MNIATNPWSFVSGDVVTATPAASPTGLVLNADGTVSLTTTAGHGLTSGQYATVFGATNAAYNGFYYLLVAAGTTATMIPQFSIPAGTAASGGGTVAKNQYNAMVRIEDISWQNASAAGQLLEIRDRMGNIIWSATATGAGSQNRGKVFWVNGVTVTTLGSGIVLMTIN